MKRYKECNWLVKIWRNRHYIPVPFQWFWSHHIISRNYTNKNGGDSMMRGDMLWSTLISEAQIKMGNYLTHDEVKKRFGSK